MIIMDRYLIDKFIAKSDDELYKLMSSYFISESKDRIHVDNKTFHSYYPSDGYSFQFVVNTSTDKNDKTTVEDLYIHHNSCDVWDIKIGPKLRATNTYAISTDNDDRTAVIRFINHDEGLLKYKEGKKIRAQVVGFVLNGNIYESEEAYEKAAKAGKVAKVDDNCMLPLCLLLNNNPKKPKAERDKIPPDDDRILTVKFKIESCHKFPLHIFGQDRPAYYAAGVETAYGHMYLFFNMDLLDKPVEQFKKGDIFAGNIMLSGDDAIYSEKDACYHASTKKELESIIERSNLVGRTIEDIDTYGVIDDLAPRKKRVTDHILGFCTDLPMLLKLSDERTIRINAPSFKDIYEGFNVTINPKPSENERDNDLDVAKYCKECLGKKIVGWKVTKYGEKVPDYVQDITSESPKELILELEDGIKMIFSHWLMAEYMDFTIKFPEKNKGK